MQTTLACRVELSVQVGSSGGGGGGRDLRELSGGAPGWPEEEGFPFWKTAVPGALKGESFLYICAPRLHCHVPRGHSQQDRLLSLGSA